MSNGLLHRVIIGGGFVLFEVEFGVFRHQSQIRIQLKPILISFAQNFFYIIPSSSR